MLDAEKLAEFTEAAANVLSIDQSKLVRETDLKKDCVISSIVRFQLMGDMEDVFGVTVKYARMAKCKTFGDILDLIEENI